MDFAADTRYGGVRECSIQGDLRGLLIRSPGYVSYICAHRCRFCALVGTIDQGTEYRTKAQLCNTKIENHYSRAPAACPPTYISSQATYIPSYLSHHVKATQRSMVVWHVMTSDTNCAQPYRAILNIHGIPSHFNNLAFPPRPLLSRVFTPHLHTF